MSSKKSQPIMTIDGLPVKDARKSVILHVTTGDIRKAKVKDPSACAAALACKRDLGAKEAQIHKSRTYLRFNGHWTRYLTPASLQAEIVAFDRGGRFEPGEHRLTKMAPSRPFNKKTGPRKTKGKLRGSYHRVANIRSIALVA